MLHELAHTAIADLDLPVLGREEDAADNFAVLRLLHVGSDLSHRVLVEAAKGWFLSDRRDREEGEKPVLFDNHGLDQQRAYQIVCLMVGSDPNDFTDLADETKLPNYRQEGCKKDYAKAFTSWNTVLKPHVRQPDQQKTHIDVAYGDGKGNLDGYAKAFRHLRLLETVAEHLENDVAWPAPFTLEMQSCGFINAQWINPDRKLLLCYELAADFAELYRDFNECRKPRNRQRGDLHRTGVFASAVIEGLGGPARRSGGMMRGTGKSTRIAHDRQRLDGDGFRARRRPRPSAPQRL